MYKMVNNKTSTIRITEDLKKKLDKLKVHPRQPYEEVILKLINSKEELK